MAFFLSPCWLANSRSLFFFGSFVYCYWNIWNLFISALSLLQLSRSTRLVSTTCTKQSVDVLVSSMFTTYHPSEPSNRTKTSTIGSNQPAKSAIALLTPESRSELMTNSGFDGKIEPEPEAAPGEPGEAMPEDFADARRWWRRGKIWENRRKKSGSQIW